MNKFIALLLGAILVAQTQAGIILLDGKNPETEFYFKEGATRSTIKWQFINGAPNTQKIGMRIGSDIDGSPRAKHLDITIGSDTPDRSTISYDLDLTHFRSSIDEDFILGSNIFAEMYVAYENSFFYSDYQRNPNKTDVWDLLWLEDNKLMLTLFDNDLGINSFRLTIDNVMKLPPAGQGQGNDPVGVSEPASWGLFVIPFLLIGFRQFPRKTALASPSWLALH